MDGVDRRQRGERDKIDGHECFISVIGYTHDRCTSFVPVGGSNRDKRPKSRLEPPPGRKDHFFVPVGDSNRDKKAPDSSPAGLAVGPGQKSPLVSGPTAIGTNDLDQRLSPVVV